MPKISIALFGRNDNYEGDFLDKLKLSIKSIQRALKDIDYEIILLDYNPPIDKLLLSEYFSSNKYSRIKHVVFSNEDHLEFIEQHLKVGAKLIYKGKIIPEKEIYKIDFFGPIAGGLLSVKNCSGDYILSTGTDNIFPDKFGKFVERLKPNILYRTWMYRIYNNFYEIEKLFLNNIKKFVEKCGLIEKVRFELSEIKFKKEISLWNSCGNFILMDKNSWKEIGGYLPTINPRLPMCDVQVIFHALALNKKIKCCDFPIFNIHKTTNLKYKKMSSYSNYIVNKNDIYYNHVKEIGKGAGRTGCKEWQRFRKWAMPSHLKPNEEYFVEINYKERLKEIQKLFKIFLSEKFLIN